MLLLTPDAAEAQSHWWGRRPLAVASAILSFALLVASAAWATDELLAGGERGTNTRPVAVSREPSTVNAAANRRDAVQSLFRARSRAVLSGDKAAFLDLVDPSSETFYAQQSRLYDRLVKVPFTSWSYELREDGSAFEPDGDQQLPNRASTAHVALQYTFEGSPSPVNREQYFTLVPDGPGWLLSDDRGAAGERSQRDVWDFADITVVHGAKTLVIGAATPDRLRRYARLADLAVDDVERVWQLAWPRRAVVIVPRSQADMAAIIDSDGKGLDQIAAVTTGHTHTGRTRGDRVVINPKAWPQLNRAGRRVVMTHEVTHLATRASTNRPLPTWMSEGFSDYVAYSQVDVSDRVVARDLLRLVRNGKTPQSLPGDGDFDAAQGAIGPAYEAAWLVCRYIADRFGEDKLVELYLTLADTTPAPLGDDIEQVLGITQAQLVKAWRAELEAMARR